MSGVRHVEIAEDLTFVKFKCILIVLMFQHGCLISGSLVSYLNIKQSLH